MNEFKEFGIPVLRSPRVGGGEFLIPHERNVDPEPRGHHRFRDKLFVLMVALVVGGLMYTQIHPIARYLERQERIEHSLAVGNQAYRENFVARDN